MKAIAQERGWAAPLLKVLVPPGPLFTMLTAGANKQTAGHLPACKQLAVPNACDIVVLSGRQAMQVKA